MEKPNLLDELKALEAYRLCGYVVTENEGWYVVVDDASEDAGGPVLLGGSTSVNDGVLWLSPYQLIGYIGEATLHEVKAYIGKLPKWAKTKYALEFLEQEPNLLIDCETEQIAQAKIEIVMDERGKDAQE